MYKTAISLDIYVHFTLQDQIISADHRDFLYNLDRRSVTKKGANKFVKVTLFFINHVNMIQEFYFHLSELLPGDTSLVIHVYYNAITFSCVQPVLRYTLDKFFFFLKKTLKEIKSALL